MPISLPSSSVALTDQVLSPVRAYSKLTRRVAPRLSMTPMAVVIGVPSGALALRLPPSATEVVETGAMDCPSGSRMSLDGPLTFMTPVVGSAIQPCTIEPVGSARLPRSSKPNEPARVYSCSVPLRTTK